MPRGILVYNINNIDDKLEFAYALSGKNACLALSSIQEDLHQKYKYKELSEAESQLLIEIKQLIYDTIAKYNLNVDGVMY